MKNAQITLEEIWDYARQLPPLEKLRLIERLTPELEKPLKTASPKPHRRGLLGLLKGCNISNGDINEIRKEMFGNFPRGDL